MSEDILRASLNRASTFFLGIDADDFTQAPGLGLEFRYLCSRLRRTENNVFGSTDKPLNELDDDGLKTPAKDLMLFIQKTKLPRYESIIPDHFEQNK